MALNLWHSRGGRESSPDLYRISNKVDHYKILKRTLRRSGPIITTTLRCESGGSILSRLSESRPRTTPWNVFVGWLTREKGRTESLSCIRITRTTQLMFTRLSIWFVGYFSQYEAINCNVESFPPLDVQLSPIHRSWYTRDTGENQRTHVRQKVNEEMLYQISNSAASRRHSNSFQSSKQCSLRCGNEQRERSIGVYRFLWSCKAAFITIGFQQNKVMLCVVLSFH